MRQEEGSPQGLLNEQVSIVGHQPSLCWALWEAVYNTAQNRLTCTSRNVGFLSSTPICHESKADLREEIPQPISPAPRIVHTGAAAKKAL